MKAFRELVQGHRRNVDVHPACSCVFALLKQGPPRRECGYAKSALMTNGLQSVLDNNRTTQADPFDMGAGHINPGANG